MPVLVALVFGLVLRVESMLVLVLLKFEMLVLEHKSFGSVCGGESRRGRLTAYGVSVRRLGGEGSPRLARLSRSASLRFAA